jgi:hypothetical protein
VAETKKTSSWTGGALSAPRVISEHSGEDAGRSQHQNQKQNAARGHDEPPLLWRRNNRARRGEVL